MFASASCTGEREEVWAGVYFPPSHQWWFNALTLYKMCRRPLGGEMYRPQTFTPSSLHCSTATLKYRWHDINTFNIYNIFHKCSSRLFLLTIRYPEWIMEDIFCHVRGYCLYFSCWILNCSVPISPYCVLIHADYYVLGPCSYSIHLNYFFSCKTIASLPT